MKLKRSRRSVFKKARVRGLVIWYLILLGAILVLVWKMPSLVLHL